MMIKEVKYTLQNAFEYTTGGQKVFAKEITLRAPTRAILSKAYIIKGQILKSGIQAQSIIGESVKKEIAMADTPAEKKDGDYMSILCIADDIEKIFEAFDYILTAESNGLKFALIDGKEPFTSLLIERLSKEDYEGMLGLYIKSFLALSP